MKKIASDLIPIVEEHCKNLLQETSGVFTVVLATADGFDIASASIRETDPAKIAAMSSSMMSICSAAADETHLGSTNGMTITSDKGLLYSTHIEINGLNYILCVIADSSVIQAQVIYRCNDLSKRLKFL